jgi:ferritin
MKLFDFVLARASVVELKAFAEMTELQWFLTEQVEEEKTSREIVAKFRLVGDDPGSLLDLDRDLGGRVSR